MTFYFYDLETSGFSPRTARIMQFAGQRTDMDLKPVGEPDNFLIKLTDDILPDPGAVLVHGITPQQTISEGLTEAEFFAYFNDKIAVKDTIFTGYNSVRFDDEFMRFSLWRNFSDPYEWQWKNGNSRWDLLDVARMTRALRPEGINWPFAPDGKPSNRLEMLAAVNKLEHANAHDALSDVMAVIELAKLIKTKQPKLFDYLLNIRGKRAVEPFVTKGEPFVYTSGRYPGEYEKTTVVVMIAEVESGALVYDLRVSPDEFTKMEPAQLATLWQDFAKDAPYFPVKKLAYNKVPAIAPLSVLDKDSAARLKIDKNVLGQNLQKLKAAKGFDKKLADALEIVRPKSQTKLVADPLKVDEQLYDGFVPDTDKTKMSVVRAAGADKIAEINLDFSDERLKLLFPLYKARNYPKSLTGEELETWEEYRSKKLLDGGPQARASKFFTDLTTVGNRADLSGEQRYLLEELNLYGQSIIPELG